MFDSVLKRESLPKRRFGSGAVIGLSLYFGAAAFALWMSTHPPQKNVEDVAVTFVKAPPPPPPPPPPPAPKTVRPKVVKTTEPKTVLQQAIVAPTVIPDEKPPEKEPTNDTPVTGEGVEGGEVGGVAGGIKGGVVDAVDVPAPRMEFDERTMSQPVKIAGPVPQYTDKALEREIQGTMIVRCVIAVDGRVFDCQVVKSLPFMDRAVIEALERSRFTPATMAGRPVEVYKTFKINLRLPD